MRLSRKMLEPRAKKRSSDDDFEEYEDIPEPKKRAKAKPQAKAAPRGQSNVVSKGLQATLPARVHRR